MGQKRSLIKGVHIYTANLDKKYMCEEDPCWPNKTQGRRMQMQGSAYM